MSTYKTHDPEYELPEDTASEDQLLFEADKEIAKPKLPIRKCLNHDISWPLMGENCPNCNRRSLFAFDWDEQ